VKVLSSYISTSRLSEARTVIVHVPVWAALGDQTKSPLADKLGSVLALPDKPVGKISE